MIGQIAWGVALMIATTFVHAGCTVLFLNVRRNVFVERWVVTSTWAQTVSLASVVVLLMLASMVESAIWAVTYVYLGTLSHFEEALYFSTVTFTTLGFGDITLGTEWRLLASFEAANGILLFGWSTALVFAFLQRLVEGRQAYREETAD
jgi:hypothetical protein